MRSRKARVAEATDEPQQPIIPRIGLLLDALPEAVVTTDSDYRINGWNRAAERLFRLTRSTMIGASIFETLAQELGSFTGTHLKAALDRSEIWTGGATTTDASGAVLELRLTAAAIGGVGAPEGFVIVAHDDQEREAQASLLAGERAVVAGALGRLRSVGSVETIGAAIARLVLGLPGVDVAAVLLFEQDGRATPVGLALADGPVPERRSVPIVRSRALRRRCKVGPWVEAWKPSEGDPLNDAIHGLDIGVMGYAPIRSGDDLLGVLAVGAAGASGQTAVTERLPAIVEFAGLAGVLLGSSVAARLEYRRARSEIRSVVEGGGFHPVFQPIVEMVGRTTVGYEALTRFRDGVPPDVRFAAAAAVGLGPELELATLAAALRAAADLPPGLWLNINVSPSFALGGGTLRSILATETRPIVCEVTEHAAIEDYDAFRAAVAGLDGVLMAVDDAGAGFSSFRHILELRPAFVKLDRSLVAGIDGDPVRQALIAGMCHFASSAGCRLVAEGIETEAEMATLIELKVPLGQGYLLGYPAPAGVQ